MLCLAWGFFIPAGIVVAAFRTVTKLGSAWWYYVHVSFQTIGFLLSLAGIAVGCYFPADDKLMVQHKIIGIVVNVVAGLQVIFAQFTIRLSLKALTCNTCILCKQHLLLMTCRYHTTVQTLFAALQNCLHW